MRFSLNGDWELSSDCLESPIVGQVPGNIELDLWRAGLEPEPYYGDNTFAYRKYGREDWTYRRSFVTPAGMSGACELVFEGIDCFGSIIFNGEDTGYRSENALIPHRVFVELKPEGEENTVEVELTSPETMERFMPEEYGAITHMPEAVTNLWMRRPGHSYGWDIAPKFNLGGIWRNVYVEKSDATTVIKELWFRTERISGNSADIDVYFVHDALDVHNENMTLWVRGICGDSVFEQEFRIYSSWGHAGFNRSAFRIDNVKLWEPAGYGEANLYDVNAELRIDGRVVGVASTRFGVRTIELDRSDINVAGTGWFHFVINGKKTRVYGSNWVPADAFHSQDSKRVVDILKLFTDSHCNMVRCWGGGVYEDEEFYDYCDEHGLLVWQDFMFSGFKYPQHQAFLEQVRVEAESVVRRLRRRTCLALWCGDNECDQKYLMHQEDPRKNKVNREVLPEVLYRLDPTRPYLPSSPYLSDKAFDFANEKNGGALTLLMPERHLWGSRENFRQPFYTAVNAKFVSEMGWHGCPSLESLKKYIAPEHLKLDCVDLMTPQLVTHASSPWPTSWMRGRNNLMVNQNDEYYEDAPSDLPNFILANQIYQAEAFKYVVEHYRMAGDCGGILWWNMMDCWPQLSDSVVDYYFNKKLAYYYLKRTQQPFVLMCTDTAGFHSTVKAVNDTRREQRGRYCVVDGETGAELLKGEFCVAAGGQAAVGRLRSRRSKNELWLLEWETDSGERGVNHFVSGNRVMNYGWYKGLLDAIGAQDGAYAMDGLEVVPGT